MLRRAWQLPAGYEIFKPLIALAVLLLLLSGCATALVLAQGGTGREVPNATPRAPTNRKPAARQSPCVSSSPQSATGKERKVDLGNGVKLELVELPAGDFCMGSTAGEPNERPVHRVSIFRSFYIGRYEVTVAEWLAVMGNVPEPIDLERWSNLYKSKRQPIVSISWNDAQEFIGRLNAKGDGYTYRLPTEAEWEYACRAGTTTTFAFGNSLSSTQANFDGNYPYGGGAKGISLSNTMIVGSFRPNNFGLYDMHGNPWEWCQDSFHPNYLGAPVDGSAWVNGGTQERVMRGGGWANKASSCRSAQRYAFPMDGRYALVGFRIVAVARTQ